MTQKIHLQVGRRKEVEVTRRAQHSMRNSGQDSRQTDGHVME